MSRRNKALGRATRRSPTADRRRPGRRGWYLVAAFLILAAASAYLLLENGPAAAPPAPPELDVSRLERSLVRPYEMYRERVIREPASAEAWGELGMFFFAHQFEPETSFCLAEAARLDPAEVRWPYLLGLNLSVSDPAAALAQWERVVKLRPTLGIVHLRLGELFLHLHEYGEARRSLQAGLQRMPREVRALIAMARLELAEGRPAEALDWLYRIPDEQSAIRMVAELRSRIFQHQGDEDAARRELARAEQLPDESPSWRDPLAAEVLGMRHEGRASLERAEMLLQQQQAPQAIALLEQSLASDQRDPQLYTMLARAYLQVNQWARADEILQNARRQHPHSAEVWFQSGVVAFRAERYREAAGHFQAALRQKPEYALAHYNLGHTRLRLGETAEAIQSFREAVRCRPAYAEAHINLARLYLQQGNRSQAAEHVRSAQPLAPQDPELRRLARELSADNPSADLDGNGA